VSVYECYVCMYGYVWLFVMLESLLPRSC